MPENKKKDGLIVQAGILAAAGIIVRIIGLLYNTPLVAIIGDEGFGYYDSAYAAYSIVLLISSYSIPSAVSKVIAQKLAKKEYKSAHRIFKCAFIYVLVVGGIASLFVYFFASSLVKLNGAILPLKILAPTIFFSGILGVLRGYFQAHKTMVQTSVSQIVEQIANAGISVLAAYLFVKAVSNADATTKASFGAAGGTVGTGVGVLTGLLFMLFVYAINQKQIKRRMERDKTFDDTSNAEVFKMIFMVVTPFILSTGIYNINTFMDKYIYQIISTFVHGTSETTVAYELSAMAKATKISNIPIAMASAMATAMIPGISSDFARNDKKGAREKVTKSVKVTMFISIPAAVGIGVLSLPIMKVIFGQPETIMTASALLSMMAVTVILYALSTLTQAVLQSIGKMNQPILNAALAILLHVGVMVACMLFLPKAYVLYYYAGATILYALLLCVFNGLSVRRHLNYRQEVDRTFLRPLLCALIMGAAAFLVYQGVYLLTNINIISLALAVGIGCLLYFVIIIKMQAITEEEMKSLPKGTTLIRVAKKMRLLKSAEQGEKKQTTKKRTIQKQTTKQKTLQKEEENEDYWLDD